MKILRQALSIAITSSLVLVSPGIYCYQALAAEVREVPADAMPEPVEGPQFLETSNIDAAAQSAILSEDGIEKIPDSRINGVLPVDHRPDLAKVMATEARISLTGKPEAFTGAPGQVSKDNREAKVSRSGIHQAANQGLEHAGSFIWRTKAAVTTELDAAELRRLFENNAERDSNQALPMDGSRLPADGALARLSSGADAAITEATLPGVYDYGINSRVIWKLQINKDKTYSLIHPYRLIPVTETGIWTLEKGVFEGKSELRIKFLLPSQKFLDIDLSGQNLESLKNGIIIRAITGEARKHPRHSEDSVFLKKARTFEPVQPDAAWAAINEINSIISQDRQGAAAHSKNRRSNRLWSLGGLAMGLGLLPIFSYILPAQPPAAIRIALAVLFAYFAVPVIAGLKKLGADIRKAFPGPQGVLLWLISYPLPVAALAAVSLSGLFRDFRSLLAGLSAFLGIRSVSYLRNLINRHRETARLKALQAQFAPVDLKADLSSMPENEKKALAKMIQAGQVMDAIFTRQAWAGYEALLAKLKEDKTPLGRARLEYFLTMKGPWDSLNQNQAFIPDVPAKPEGANYYPAGSSKGEIERWIGSLPPEEKALATGYFTVIRRAPDGSFRSVSYSQEYRADLEMASRLLEEAAALATQPSLKNFLQKRAKAFLTNDYYDSDVAWMELNSSVEPTIGPYEVYMDEWFNYKAAFTSYIGVRDEAGTEKISQLSAQLQWLEANLPIDPKYRNPKLGEMSPIRVVDQLYASGDAAKGVTTAAFNLPNDERVVREKGSKQIMLRNIQEAKFEKVLLPISKLTLSLEDQKNVEFEAFFTHIIMHELMHGLGPHTIKAADGKETTVRQQLKELSSAFEEAKADISGLWALQQLIDKGVLDRRLERTMYVTFLASAFRTMRFGINEAHGQGQAMQLNYLMDHGAVTVRPDGTFAINSEKIKGAVESLTNEIMTIQAHGDYAAAKKMLDAAVLRPEVQAALDRLKGIPVDIAPNFVTANELLNTTNEDSLNSQTSFN